MEVILSHVRETVDKYFEIVLPGQKLPSVQVSNVKSALDSATISPSKDPGDLSTPTSRLKTGPPNGRNNHRTVVRGGLSSQTSKSPSKASILEATEIDIDLTPDQIRSDQNVMEINKNSKICP